jgi:hypothetical protein
MYLEPSDKIFFRSVNSRGIPAGVGTGNAGRPCTVITEHKEIEGFQAVRSFRDLEEFSGSSAEILPENSRFSCLVDSVGLLIPWDHKQRKGCYYHSSRRLKGMTEDPYLTKRNTLKNELL